MKISRISQSSRGLKDTLCIIGSMSDKDKKRFSQCFNCKKLDTCTLEEEAEDENGLCKFYDELPHDYEAAKNFGELLMKELEKEV